METSKTHIGFVDVAEFAARVKSVPPVALHVTKLVASVVSDCSTFSTVGMLVVDWNTEMRAKSNRRVSTDAVAVALVASVKLLISKIVLVLAF